jgi:hypothetical protein
MITVTEIEAAVKSLSRADLSRFRDWFLQFDAEAWDRQFAQDAETGKLDSLAEEALQDLLSGRCSDL